MSMDSLSKDLNSFHISPDPSSVNTRSDRRTGTVYTAATTIDSKIDPKKYVGNAGSSKFYLVNDQFIDDQFVSRLVDRDDDNDDDDDSNDEKSFLDSQSDITIGTDPQFNTVSRRQKVQSAPIISDIVRSIREEQNESVKYKAKSSPSFFLDGQMPQFMPYLKQQRAILKKDLQSDSNSINNNSNSNDNNTTSPSRRLINTSSSRTENVNEQKSGLRDPQSALVVSTGVGDLSGQILNTFKRQNELRQQSNKTVNASQNGNTSSGGASSRHCDVKEFESYGNNYPDIDDDDPAFEAKQIYDNVLRTHGPVFASGKAKVKVKSAGTNTHSTITTGSVTAFRKPTSNRQINNTGTKRENPPVKPVENLNLITPGSIGYKFKHSKGEWVPENELLNDLSTIHNNTTTNNYTSATTTSSKSNLTRTTNIVSDSTMTTTRSGSAEANASTTSEMDITGSDYKIHSSNRILNITDENHTFIMDGDRGLIGGGHGSLASTQKLQTPDTSTINPDTTTQIDIPRLKDNMILKRQLLAEKNFREAQAIQGIGEKNLGPSTATTGTGTGTGTSIITEATRNTHIHPGEVTNVSAFLNMSIKENKHDLVALITSELQKTEHTATDWTRILELTITNNPNFKNFVGLSTYLPNLVSINFQQNSLSLVNGDIPQTCKLLNLSHNDLKSPFCQFDPQNSIEELNLSHNKISPNLNPLANCHNLHSVDLSYNRIESLDRLGDSRIRKLNLSCNQIYGTLDFQRIVESNDNKFGGWLALEELDLSGNNIKQIKNLHCLPRLKVLKLDNNPMCFLDEVSLAKCCEHELESLSMLNDDRLGACTTTTTTHSSTSSTTPTLENRICVFPRLKELCITGNSTLRQDDTLQVFANKLEIVSPTLTRLRITNCTHSILNSFLLKTITTPSALLQLTIESVTDTIDFPALQLATKFPSLQELTLHDTGLMTCYDLVRYVIPSSSSSPSSLNCTLQRLDISRNPIVKRQLQLQQQQQKSSQTESPTAAAAVVDLQPRSEFLDRLRVLLRRCCSEIREIRCE